MFSCWLLFVQLCTYNVKPVSSNFTLEASFSPDGMFVVSGTQTHFFVLVFLRSLS